MAARLLPLIAVVALLAPPAQAESTVLCHLQDRRINESSGLTLSAEPGVLFTHNDSGDVARFFSVGPSCETLATFDVAAANIDWEDAARGPGSGGGTSLFLADVGDNNVPSLVKLVHEVAEPDPRAGGRLVPRTHVTVYADGRHNAEAFIVLPDGRFLVVEKWGFGPSGVYMDDGPAPVRVLRRVGQIDFDAIASPYEPLVHFSEQSRLLATGGDVSPDGTRIVVRTYVEAFEWDISGLEVGAALSRPPLRRVPLPWTEQGEAIAYAADGAGLLTTSEGVGAPVHLVSAG